MVLKDKEYSLLMQLVNNTKVFDKRDNTFLLSNRKIACKVGVSASKVDRLFRTLSKHNLIKKVINTQYTSKGLINTTPVVMLSPKFLFISFTNTDRWIIAALWELGCIAKAREWATVCKNLACWVCPETGEIKSFNWHDINTKANSYTCFDRCYRKKSRHVEIIGNNTDENSSQYYKLNELDSNGLHPYDFEWFDMINKQSVHTYKPTNKATFKTHTPTNIYTVNLHLSEELQNEDTR